MDQASMTPTQWDQFYRLLNWAYSPLEWHELEIAQRVRAFEVAHTIMTGHCG